MERAVMISSTIQSPVTQLLQDEGIAFDIIEIPLTEDKKPVRHLEELLLQRDIDPQSVVRSVLFKTDSGKFVLLAVAGGGRADWAILRKHLDERKCRMAEFDEVPAATGYVVGAVPPIALPSDIKVLVDHSVNNYNTVVIGSGVLGYALSLNGHDLLKLLANADHGIFVSSP
jgi:prolyl-tRNA editing enzyme YbaK/EbsC (Cys-tRNA(Pro) deacylase)